MTAYARQLPLAVICDLLGVSDTVKERFAAQAGRLTSVNSVLGFVRAFASLGRFTRLVEAEIERVRRSAGTGLIAELVAMQQAGEPISDDEMIAMVFLLLVAGHETTTHVISGGIYELLRDPARRQWLMADESRMALAVEEILRFISAVQFSKPRIARRDLEVEGTRVARGEMVMAMIAAANSDPAAIECPHRFDMERRANRHVAFGAGPHFCLGHQLARIEIACAIRALFATWPQLRLAVAQDDIRWRSRVGLRAIERLPATIIR